ncbi:proton-coupled amino acid transporter-like protein CG1139 isoform X1 [Sitophilus oryzae]|uniref:Proton-coupled amino acid transporter-like protein CG1139 isoform X1 n=1 Tax=Sitophilus oryzae TaxID=7048 RepID=A0A6J2YWM5_SITOR|nr:proton-coupled amino acid transporter-like protein CG1139 isoform X1 [Sitophilus oryzae]XP_030767596.1 proton-coupled amino acid transporter-like protein CG1139 isoform X1 [Sitophilus oryzae]
MEQKETYVPNTDIFTSKNFRTILVDDKNIKLQTTDPEYIIEKTYDPYKNRDLDHPNSFLGAFLHLVKGSLGTGILAVPRAFKSAGLLVGTIGAILIGILCTHAIHLLVKASHKVCIKNKLPSLGYSDTAKEVFLHGPKSIQKYAPFAKGFVEIALMSTYYLSNAVYIVFISVSLTKLFSYYYPEIAWWDHYIFKLIILLPLLGLCQIREIKHMVPFSFIANIMLAVAFGITAYYTVSGLPSGGQSDAKLATSLSGIPSFLSTVLFAMEGIGTIMPVENSMTEPKFLGWNGVLNCAMVLIVALFTVIGFLGYYRYGEDTEVTITKNLPDDEIPAQIVQAAISVSVFFTFMLIFFVPADIMWRKLKGKISEEKHNISQIILRVVMLVLITGVAIAGGEHLGGLIDLIGAIFFSSLGFFVPALLDTIVDLEEGWGIFHWRLIKNIFIMLLAIFALVCGSYYAVVN